MNFSLLRKLLPLLGLVALFVLVLVIAFSGRRDAALQLPEFKVAKPDFEDRPFGPVPEPTPTPSPKFTPEPGPPLPREWKIGAGVLGALALAAFIYGCFRAWRSSNLFDRTYRFPPSGPAAVRFGGKKSGGLLATVSFGRDDPPPARQSSKPEDA
jgi:hypothetical protein